MSIIRLAIISGALWVGYGFWQKHQESDEQAVIAAQTSKSGFIELATIMNQQKGTIYVMSPHNCPSEASQRALRLVDALKSRGLSVVHTESVVFSSIRDDGTRMDMLMEEKEAVVFINGWGKANPSLDEVLAEYEIRSGG